MVYFLTDFCYKLTTYMVRYLNYMVQFLRFQSDTTNDDVRNILLNIRPKGLLIWFGLPPALFQLVLAAAVTLVAQTHAVLKGKPLTVVSKHLLARYQALVARTNTRASFPSSPGWVNSTFTCRELHVWLMKWALYSLLPPLQGGTHSTRLEPVSRIGIL